MKTFCKKSALTLSIVMIISMLSAQEGEIKILADERIDKLIGKQSQVIPPAINPKIIGFRIQLFFDADKNKIDAARGAFMSNYKKIDTYINYNAPNFFLKAGDFRTRLEAEKIKSKIETQFPTSVIIKEKINLPRLERN